MNIHIIVGPCGSGKTTLMRSYVRLNKTAAYCDCFSINYSARDTPFIDSTLIRELQHRFAFDFIPDKEPHKYSRGENKLLALLTFLKRAQQDQKTVICIDQIETCLSVDWQRALAPLIEEVATTTKLFITTHSPIIAAAFKESLCHTDSINNLDQLLFEQRKPKGVSEKC